MPGDHAKRLFLRLFLLATVLGAGILQPGPARAQDGDEPETGKIWGYQAEIVFPAVVRFYVGVNAPLADLVSVTLTLRQESGLRVSFTLQPEENLFEALDAATTLVYDWDLASSPAPTLFEPLNYRWEIITADGQASLAADELMLQDTARGQWQSAGDLPLVLYWANPNLAGQSIRDEVMAAYGLLNRRTGNAPLFQYAIYDPGVRLCQTARSSETGEFISVVRSAQGDNQYPCSVERFEQVYAQAGIRFLQRPTLGYSELQNQLVGAMVRETYTALWGDVTVPAWFLSGLEGLYRLRPDYAAPDLVRDAVRTDSLSSLAELAEPLPADATFPQRRLREAEGYLLVLYLADRYGAEAPFQLALDVLNHPGGFDGAFNALTGDDRLAFWNDWSSWLTSPAADRAVTWTPYSPITPTPTATPTVTPVPPTPTPSSTPTSTPSPTSTFIGDQPPTVVIQELPPTPTKMRPTNTPLPPGSLPTVVPPTRPTAQTDRENNTNVILLIGIALGISVAAVILVAWWAMMLTRRR